MDINNLSNQNIQNKKSSSIKETATQASEQKDTGRADKLSLSAGSRDWRVRMRGMDSRIEALQGRLSYQQARQDRLVRIQNEMLNLDHDNHDDIRHHIHALVKDSTFNSAPLLDDLKGGIDASLYDYAARVEAEKNKAYETARELTTELKTLQVSRENLIMASTGIDPETLNGGAVEEITRYIREINQASRLDNSRIKDLLG